MRLGWDDRQMSAPFFAKEFEQIGVACVTIHGRTRAQGFGGAREPGRHSGRGRGRGPHPGGRQWRRADAGDAIRMFEVTGCHAIAIGRGALLNPWFFKQLQRWEETGDPGPPPTYDERLDFMDRHLRRLVDLRGRAFRLFAVPQGGQLVLPVIKPGRQVQQTLVMLDSLATFEDIVSWLREQGPPPGWQAGAAPSIPVPKGPNERW